MSQKDIIKDKHLRLRPLTESDLELRVQWYNDPEIFQSLIITERLGLEKTRQWFDVARNDICRLDMIIEDDQQEAIGTIGLRHISREKHSAGIYSVIGDKAYWGKGVMYEAHLLLIRYAFQNMSIKTIWANVLEYNVASMVTLKKIGFVIEVVLKNEFQREGKSFSVCRMRICADDFFKKHPCLKSTVLP